MFAKPGVVKRTSLVKLIDAGLPRWLQGIEGDRKIAKHRFQGWLIKSLHAGDPCYEDLDLRSGDVVQKVNDKSIERPEQAYEVAQSLRTASSIVVQYLRDDKPRKLTIPISDE
jgi:S1-C subfamily serine protease